MGLSKYLPKIKNFADLWDGKKEAKKMNHDFSQKSPYSYESSDMVVLMIHGINVTDAGAGTTAKFLHLLPTQKYAPHLKIWGEVVGYRWVGLPSLTNKRIAKYLAKRISYHASNGKKVAVIGHSNGCAIMDMASRLGAKQYAHMYSYLNPALRSNLAPIKVQSFHVWHTQDDDVVSWAKIISWLTFYQFNARPWGDMGKRGYNGKSHRARNIEYSDRHIFNPVGSGHSGIFNHFDYFGELVLIGCIKELFQDTGNNPNPNPPHGTEVARVLQEIIDHA